MAVIGHLGKRTGTALTAAVLTAGAFLGGCTNQPATTAPSTANPAVAVASIHDRDYIELVRPLSPGNITDQQLVDLGHAACSSLAAGTAYQRVKSAVAEQGFGDSAGMVVAFAHIYYCPTVPV